MYKIYLYWKEVISWQACKLDDNESIMRPSLTQILALFVAFVCFKQNQKSKSYVKTEWMVHSNITVITSTNIFNDVPEMWI